ncbi:MAG: hypothetical protein A2428_16835 [Bdellovibrionales bacterium RIFOXYC1_FULL_54_43]|nr:MAG: hypothetical protein A2428_16835 [Bdellovibrionales bacterium RIFOXYC1_FULL_54_43]OFZ79784.1 MAG: hypothetical protein A2603_10665 [Bdellovibrionales bacterium RIFOXYD1_FULL_55_31]
MQEIPNWYGNVFAILFGLIVGSFLNVVVVRLPQGRSIVRPRSRCPNCDKEIRWWDNIPILSYLLLHGRCRECRTPISIRYPTIELLTALIFLSAKVRFGFSWTLFFRDWPFLAILIAVTFIDLEHRIIPDRLSLGGLVLGLLTSAVFPEAPPTFGWSSSLIGASIGFGTFYLIAALYQRFAGRTGLGGGDVKLLAMLGAFLGPSGVLAIILISSILGSVIGILWALVNREKDIMKSSIPYGPFLVLGGLYYYLLGDILWLQFMTPT